MAINYNLELAKFIESLFPESYYNAGSIPEPFCGNNAIKAIVIGADPTFIKNNGKFKFVFGLEDKNSPFFRGILKNLKLLDLSLNDIYVQNLVKNYFNHETSNNKIWEYCAYLWLENLKREIDEQFDRSVPLFITAERILKVLLFGGHRLKLKPKDIYSKGIIFSPNQNYFGRNVIALFRHHEYNLEKWPHYRDIIKKYLPV